MIDTEITIEIQNKGAINTIVMKEKNTKEKGVTEIQTIITKKVNGDEEVEVDHIVQGMTGKKGENDIDIVIMIKGKMTETENTQNDRLGIRWRRRDCRRRLSMRKSRRNGSAKERRNQLN